MNALPTPALPGDLAPPALMQDTAAPQPPTEDRAERLLDRLERLANIGMRLAALLERNAERLLEAETPPTGEELAQLGQTFARVAAAVRQGESLAARVIEQRTKRGERQDSARYARQAKQARQQAAEAREDIRCRKAQIQVSIERLIARVIDVPVAMRLRYALSRRIHDLRHADVAGQTIPTLVAQVCRDIGLEPDWPLWASEPWAAESKAWPPDNG